MDPEDDEILPELWQEASWIVINSYFEENGLVRQQIESYNEFVQVRSVHSSEFQSEYLFCFFDHQISIQQIINDTPPVVVLEEPKYVSGEMEKAVNKIHILWLSI